MEPLASSERLIVESSEDGYYQLTGDKAEGEPGTVSLLLSEAELRWLVTTAGPAVLPAQKIR